MLATDFVGDADARAYLHGRAEAVMRVLLELWQMHAMPDTLALVAVGGFGRGELFPGSDVDLLILRPETAPTGMTTAIERFIGALWDVGLDVGHSVRDIAACLEESAQDITVQTSLLEARWLGGSEALFSAFKTRFLAGMDAEQFLFAKRLEQQERYARQGDTPYSLEPNCKESPGGLRDLQVIRWVAQAAGLGSQWAQLAARVGLSSEELRQLTLTENFLNQLRVRLHLLSQRREDRLLFDHQEKLAAAMGISARQDLRAAEILMQRYYRNAKRITQLNTLVLQNLSGHIGSMPVLPPIVINRHFQAVRGFLDLRDEMLFEHTPGAILEAFLLMARRQELQGMTARTLRALWHARGRIDRKFRIDPNNQRNFLALFKARRGLTHALRRMNQYDILGQIVPAFGRIVGRMQHDLFHIYTVDQHILQVVRNLRRLALPEHSSEFPYCARLMADYKEPWLLYIAALFHDIAKGRGGDHSSLGAQEAHRFCTHYGFAENETNLVCFLVAQHLTMSSIAQKSDLSDPQVIEGFAHLVGDARRLTGLYLLTVCDIRGTSPKVWNVWKGKLLEDLYRNTLAQLSGQKRTPSGQWQRRQTEVRRQLRLFGLRNEAEAELWQEFDTVYFLQHDADEIAWHTRHLYHHVTLSEPVVKARLHPVGGIQVMVWAADQKFLFARLCGFFTRLGFNIVEAKIHTTKSGMALDTFALLDTGYLNQAYRDLLGLIEHELSEHLRLAPPLTPPPKSRVPRQVRHFPIPPTLSIRNEEGGGRSVMFITAVDRPGLLYGIAYIFGAYDVRLHNAKIATLGERVEDTFLISGAALTRTSTLLAFEQETLQVLAI